MGGLFVTSPQQVQLRLYLFVGFSLLSLTQTYVILHDEKRKKKLSSNSQRLKKRRIFDAMHKLGNTLNQNANEKSINTNFF
tara:strand:+ start:1849 stop:2091 length:243 start_codon:yes stop_codon:yes gene_type:complete